MKSDDMWKLVRTISSHRLWIVSDTSRIVESSMRLVLLNLRVRDRARIVVGRIQEFNFCTKEIGDSKAEDSQLSADIKDANERLSHSQRKCLLQTSWHEENLSRSSFQRTLLESVDIVWGNLPSKARLLPVATKRVRLFSACLLMFRRFVNYWNCAFQQRQTSWSSWRFVSTT